MERKESKFMKWGDAKEGTLSHFVAWTLKCATKEGEETYGKVLSNYSKKILLYLLFGKDYLKEDYSVKEVNVRREWQKLDIVAEITLEKNVKKIKYALFIEMKHHKHTSKEQLLGYIKASTDYDYKGKGFNEKFVVLGVWDDAITEEDRENCGKEFSIFTFQDILDEVFGGGASKFEGTENRLFDEFWTGIWG